MKDIWIDFREVKELQTTGLPNSLYEWTQKCWSNMWIFIANELIDELTDIVEQYLRVMWLDSTKFPARVDLWFSEGGSPIIYEITTGFVDQVGSCLLLQEALWSEVWIHSLSRTPFDASILTSRPYKPEYDVMRAMFEKSWQSLWEGEGKNIFVYGYPTDDMRESQKFIPAWRWLQAEEKITQSKIISRLSLGASYISPRVFSILDTQYTDLPDEKFSRLIFKQCSPKLKWDRNTVVFWKWRQVKARYEDANMLAQEYIPPYRDSLWRRFEAKVLFMPSESWTHFTGLYTLVDDRPASQNFWNTNIPNDGYPQGPWIIIF